MTSNISLPHKGLNSTWLHRRIYYLAAGFMFAAAALRAFIIFKDGPLLDQTMLSLAAWLFLFLANMWLANRLPWISIVIFVLETSLILFLLQTTEQDFFAFLFAILSMQVMQKYSPWIMGVLIGLSAILTYLVLVGSIDALQALAMALIYAALGAFLAAYIWSTRRAAIIREQQQLLVDELQEANLRLEFHSHRQEQLAAGSERQRLARELHDSVTQTLFSMTLTTQSALLLLERDRDQVTAQLDRLDQLAQSAMSEIQLVITRMAPQAVTDGGFVAALKRHLEDRQRLDNLDVTLELEGDQPLNPAEQTGLFRISQEALNNVVKHARTSQATIRLHLTEPFWMEVEDRGDGFNTQQIRGGDHMGMAGMSDRAAEIDWVLRVKSSPRQGTCIRAEKNTGGGNNLL